VRYSDGWIHGLRLNEVFKAIIGETDDKKPGVISRKRMVYAAYILDIDNERPYLPAAQQSTKICWAHKRHSGNLA
jgi:hypothetical protein